MTKSRQNRSLMVTLVILGLCMLLLACSVSGNPGLEIFAVVGILGLHLLRDCITFRDAKHTPDVSKYADTNFQIYMNFGADTEEKT